MCHCTLVHESSMVHGSGIEAIQSVNSGSGVEVVQSVIHKYIEVGLKGYKCLQYGTWKWN